MTANVLVQFIASMDELRTRNDIIAEWERVLERVGFDYYGLSRRACPNEPAFNPRLAERWPEHWPEVYAEKKYAVIDPAIRYLGHAQGAFRWRDALFALRSDPQSKNMERMMTDARHRGLQDGYVFPVYGRRGLAGTLTIGGRSVDLGGLDLSLIETLARKMFWKILAMTDTAAAERIGAPFDVQMTRREMEALTYLADGMTSHEIARILNISSHTVDWYMNGIQDKLGAKNRHHAVATAFRLGLVS